MNKSIHHLINEVRACTICKNHLPDGVNPILEFSSSSKILLISQAPGRVVHLNNKAWADKSGKRLRDWLSVSEEQFYDTDNFAILPMGFCYPGKGKSGDLPPRKKCAPLWHPHIFNSLENVKLKLLIGAYAQDYYLESTYLTLTERVKHHHEFLPEYFPLPHPSPRNNIWMKKNEWFSEEVLPVLKEVVHTVLEQTP